jgi:dihydroorotate dehydrogenase
VIGYEGITAFRNISCGIKKYLESKGFKKVTEIVGLAHRY